MDRDAIKLDIDRIIRENINESIGCCEEDDASNIAYCNIGSMYDKTSTEVITMDAFRPYMENIDILELANRLAVDYSLLNDLFIYNKVPSSGLLSAISLVLNLSKEDFTALYFKAGYKKDESFKIINYFFENNIRDVEFLNELLVSHGLMYLYSKRKLR